MYAVTGATGQLGRLVVEGLLKTIDPSDIVAAVRTPGKASDLAARGVTSPRSRLRPARDPDLCSCGGRSAPAGFVERAHETRPPASGSDRCREGGGRRS